MLFVGREGKTSENDMTTRIIGGVAYEMVLWQNEAGQQYIPAVSVTYSQLATLGAPAESDTYPVDENNIPYKWNPATSKWIPLFPNSNVPGPAGTNGTNGVSPVLSIGTVASGSPAAATLTGTLAAPILNLTIPPGANGTNGTNGTNGANNTLSIGAVTQGAAAATITGTSPAQTLNLVLPKGDTGPANTLSIGTVSTLSVGSSATVSITGTSPAQTLNLGIPVGATGAAGANGSNNTLSIGTVSTLAAGASATATITGASPSQTLNLGIPQGVGAGAIYKQSVGLSNGSKIWYGTATTNASGAWSVDYTNAGFTATPVVQAQPITTGVAAANLMFATPQTVNSTTCSGIAGAGATVAILGGLGIGLLGAGVTIHVVAVGV